MRVLLVALGLSFAGSAAAQVVTGTVTDSTEAGLPGATVVLVQAADSLIVGFGASKPDGTFRVRVGPGAYRLQVTYVGYQTATRNVEVAGEDVDVGRIALAEDTAGLDSLVVTADRVPLLVRGDTLDFDATVFGAPPGSSVEDLLRRLPGVEVDRDGSIEAQGEAVQRVLVDGKEFFGTDPKTATRNLPADAVERVQIFDKASETAEFTGVDDGQDARTINLALKEDRRTGWFGSVGGGLGGSQGADSGARYDGKASLNRFSPSTQLAFLGNANNLNRQDFDVREVVQFSGGIGALNGTDLSGLVGPGGGGGVSSTASGGVNLNHDFGARTELRSSYFASGVDAERSRDARQRRVLGAGASSTVEETGLTSSAARSHRLNLDLKHTLADGHDVRLRSALQTSHRDGRSQRRSETRGPDETLEADRLTTSDTDRRSPGGSASLLYRKRLGTRSVVAQLRGALHDGDEARALVSADLDGAPPSLPPLDQLQTERGTSRTGSGSVLLTQPLGAGRALQLDLEVAVESEDERRTVLDRLTGVPDDALSSAFERTTRTTQGGLTFRDNTETRTVSLGLDLQHSRLDGEVLGFGTTVTRPDLHLLPSAALEVTLPRGQTLSADYAASVALPTLHQLQPVADNRDPLDVYVGNPALRPEVQHALSARFFHFDSFALTNLFAFASATYTPAAISTARTIDERFRQTRTPINLGSAWSASGSVSYGTPFRPLRSKVGLSVGSSYRRQTERLNGLVNASDLTQTTVRLSVENQRKTHADVRAGVRAALNTAAYSLNPEFDRSYVSRALFAEASAEVGGAWRLETEFEVERTPADVFGTARSLPLWSAEVSRQIGGRVRLALVGQDLLDQGLAVTYASTGALVQEERVRSLGRYVLLRLTYSLSDVRR